MHEWNVLFIGYSDTSNKFSIFFDKFCVCDAGPISFLLLIFLPLSAPPLLLSLHCTLHAVPVFHYSDRRKEQVSTHLEGELKSTFDRVEAESHGQYAKPKNFIAENAIKAITMRPPSENTPEWHTNYKKRPGFGEIPSYLSTVKSEIAAEKEQVRTVMAQERNAQRRASPQMRVMSEEERQLMLTSLKQKWEAVNKQYQTITHIVTLDTIGKIRRKEEYEQQLIQLERSIEKLSKKVVYVYDDLSNEQQVAV